MGKFILSPEQRNRGNSELESIAISGVPNCQRGGLAGACGKASKNPDRCRLHLAFGSEQRNLWTTILDLDGGPCGVR